MANDVEIIVEASLGDTLVKLDLAKHAVNELGDAGSRVGHALGDANNQTSFASRLDRLGKTLSGFRVGGPFGLGAVVSGIVNLAGGAIQAGTAIGTLAQAFGNWLVGVSDGVPILGSFGVALGGLVAAFGELLPFVTPVIAALLIVPVVAAAATFALHLLGGAVLTLAAVLVGFIPPLTLLATLMGGFGAAIVIAGKRALEGGPRFAALHRIIDQIRSGFDALEKTLALRLRPVFELIGNDVLRLIHYFDNLAKLPLDQAIKNFSTHGVHLISQMVDQIAHLLASPFKAMVSAAFASGSQMRVVLIHQFNELRDYLFGHAESIFVAPIHQTMTTHVPGALQPILDWFNRQHFTQTGLRWLGEITHALMTSGAWASLWGSIKAQAAAAGAAAGHAFAAAAEAELVAIIQWPLGGPGAPAGSPSRGGQHGTVSPTGHIAHNTFNFQPSAGLSPAAERAQFSRFTRQVGAELSRQQHLLAGGN